MKRVLGIIIVVCMLFSFGTFAQAADYSLAIHNNVAVMVGSTTAIAQNSIVTLPVAPVMSGDSVMVPIRFVTEAFGGEVSWNDATKEINITFGQDKIVQMVIGNTNVGVNGQIYQAAVAPQIIDGYTMLPVEFFAEDVLGKYVYFDAATQMAVITTRKCLSERDTDAISTIAGAIMTASLPEIVITAPLTAGDSAANSMVAGETGKLSFVSISANQEPEPDNNGQCAIDGSTGTRWASQGAATAILDLGSAKPVTNIKVAVWKPTERNTNYSIEVSANGTAYKTIFDGASSGSTWDSYDVNDTIRYVRFNPNGTSAGDWASILEIEAWNGTASTAGASGTVKPVSVTADQEPEPANGKDNPFDDDTETRYACEGTGTLTADLGSAMNVSSLELFFWQYDARTTNFEIQVSANGSSYTSVFSGNSTQGTEWFKVNVNQSVRYIRFIGKGTSTGTWTSLNEMRINTGAGGAVTTPTTPTVSGAAGAVIASATGTKAALTEASLTVSQTPEPENNQANIIDGDKQTFWASQNEANVVIDLGSAKTVSCVGVAMRLYEDDRTIPFMIEVSADGKNYSEVYSGSSVSFSNETIYVSVGSSARYVRITSYGNTISGWTSMAEVEVYTN